jgi:hypothetical protein
MSAWPRANVRVVPRATTDAAAAGESVAQKSSRGGDSSALTRASGRKEVS